MPVTAVPPRIDAAAPLESQHDPAPGLIERLYRAEVPMLTRRLRRHTPRPEDVVDLIHDGFVRLLAMGSSRLSALERQQPAAYLNRSVRNIAIDRARADRRQRPDLHGPYDDVVVPAVDPHVALEARDSLRRVEQVLLGLRPRTRAIYIAHRVHGMDYEEIAKVCGITVKGVEKQMSRAIAAIDRHVDRERHER